MNQKGIALLITMLILGAIIATSLGVAVLITGEISITSTIDDSVLAIFAADAGMEKLFYFVNRLNGNPVDVNFTETLSNNASFSACTVSQDCTNSQLESVGQFNSAQRSWRANY